ncbi:hypothetical protein JOD64_000718 [Micromonospora luteifusca]|uniref:Uncharacterized protein n=1 Tax=Micromonospora luteifusca TaxID=709860 RepID=A0ABS2LMS9_9ACTN|nr:hypothetical protein [Micromonospora luteifusca]MBM7489496.1 hypothetical protein [Micromonospora luteifusca]
MTIPLTPRIMDAICLDHVIPTGTGVHLQIEPPTADGSPLLAEANDLPGNDGITYLSLGTGMVDAVRDLAGSAVGWQDGIRTAGEAGPPSVRRTRALLYQFLRGIPPIALDRMVVHSLGQDVLGLGDAAAQANVIGLPVYAKAAGLRPHDPAAGPPVDRDRLLAFDREMRPTTSLDDAYVVGVVPDRHWVTDPYADVSDEIAAEVLKHPYPFGRMVFDGDRVHLGLPAGLADRAYARPLRELGRPLTREDLSRTGTPVRGVDSYGELFARMAAPLPDAAARYALVAVDGLDAGTSVYLGVHDEHGVSFLDFSTGHTAVFPRARGGIEMAELAGDAEILGLLRDLDGSRTPEASTRRPLAAPPSGVRVHRQVGRDEGHAVELIGKVGSMPDRFLEQVTRAAGDGEQDVIVIGGGRPAARPSAQSTRGDRLRLEMRLFQYYVSGAVPTVVAWGDVDKPVLDILDRYHVPLVRRTTGAAGAGSLAGGGLSLNLDNLWEARGPEGSAVSVPPQKDITPALLRAATDRRRESNLTRLPERLLSYLSLPLNDTSAIRAELAEHGPALRELRPQIDGLGVDPDVFAAHARFLGMTQDLLDVGLGVHEAATAEERHERILSAVPGLVVKEPEARRTAFEDLASITLGTLDDGASRAILRAVGMRLDGESREKVEQEIFRHAAYLPREGRPNLLRILAAVAPQLPEKYRPVLDEVAIHVADCPDL